jgi:alpha-amylase
VLDTVINHRCGDTQNEKGKWVMFSDEMGHDNKRLDWGPWALTSNHPDPDLAGTGAVKMGGGPTMNTHYGAAPNVDHSNTEVRSRVE